MKKVDFGCGNSKKEGYIGVDCLGFPGVDIIHDLNNIPYPFNDNELSEVYMDNVLEHLDEPLDVLSEIYRISKPGAIVTISVPYFRSNNAFVDPTHKNFYSVYSFYFFDKSHWISKKYAYIDVDFKVKSIVFDQEWATVKKNILHKLFLFIAEKNPIYYEEKFSHLYPLNSLTFHLEVVK